MTNHNPTPAEQQQATATARRSFTIGLPRCDADNRFPLTPEAAQQLCDSGFEIRMERGAGDTIHYNDAAYTRRGVQITDRAPALRCDIVVTMVPPSVRDVADMRRGAMLLTMSSLHCTPAPVWRALVGNAIVTIALDMITDSRGNRPFADILNEIDGRAAMVIAASMMADVQGKGILPGGVAGITPCEVAIIGSDIAARAAARSASGLGAIVRMFDNDTYCLREAIQELGQQVIGSTMHRSVLSRALATADVVIVTPGGHDTVIDAEDMRGMKAGVISIDLQRSSRTGAFVSLPQVWLDSVSRRDIPGDTRVCLRNTGNAVPRTAAMALSDTLLTMLRDVVSCEGVTNALKLSKGLQGATLTFLGKATDEAVARAAGLRHTDINLFLQFS